MSETLAIFAVVTPIAVNGLIFAFGYGKLKASIDSIKADVEELKELHPRSGESK